MAGRRKRGGKWILVLLGLAAVAAASVLLVSVFRKEGTIVYGSVSAQVETTAVMIRDEETTYTDNYEKVIFEVVEGERISGAIRVAQVFKRGYQDETMVGLLNLEKQVLAQQLALLGTTENAELATINTAIEELAVQIREISRGESDADMLTIERELDEQISARNTLLRSIVPADATLSALYTQLDDQQSTVQSWKRDVYNSGGTGIVSFYFDGYEKALNTNKLANVNAALISSVIRGGNTASSTDVTSEIPLYRLINESYWVIAYVTDADTPMRAVSGQSYFVTFPDYSEQIYTATARNHSVTEGEVANILEFNADIGQFTNIRTLSAVISVAAQGMVVPLDAIDILDDIPGIYIKTGEGITSRIQINVVAQDEANAVILPYLETDVLSAGMKFVKP